MKAYAIVKKHPPNIKEHTIKINQQHPDISIDAIT